MDDGAVGRIPRSENNGWEARVAEQNALMEEMVSHLEEVVEHQQSGGGGGGFFGADEWRSLRLTIAGLVISGILLAMWGTFLAARDNGQTLDDMEPRILRLENWQRAHIEGHP